jgi:tRNA A-37 threonylcarbamoyl transferase component Bud32
MELEPIKTFRLTTNKVSRFQHDGRELLVKHYTGADQQARRDREERTLELWREYGFHVPVVRKIAIPQLLDEPQLVLDYLGSLTLQEMLKNPAVPHDEKLESIAAIFIENSRRHRLALERSEPFLIHADANTSNILCHDGTFYFIDFENTPEGADLTELAAIETAKFTRWVARDCGIELLPAVVSTLVEAYRGNQEILQTIVGRTTSRPFQWYHRWRDRSRKRRNPAEVTKYDIADAVAAGLKRKGTINA